MRVTFASVIVSEMSWVGVIENMAFNCEGRAAETEQKPNRKKAQSTNKTTEQNPSRQQKHNRQQKRVPKKTGPNKQNRAGQTKQPNK